MYQTGFGNYHVTEAIEHALPKDQNSPQHTPLGLYAEQISGSAFTRPRTLNRFSWLYRMLPSVSQGTYVLNEHQLITAYQTPLEPNPLRWSPIEHPDNLPCDFIKGLFFVAGNALNKTFIYHCNQSMIQTFFVSHDGELLFIPYEGDIRIHTEMGIIDLSVGMIAVIPRGIKFKVDVLSPQAKGYLAENGGQPFSLPALGAIGANGLAHPRHFEYPVAAFEKTSEPCMILCKSQQTLWRCNSDHSPLNVVAWHGNHAPYRYDLRLFNTINSVSFDHPDPSIFTVLTSESDYPGIANLDFVVFPPRWMVAEHTFRPPYFHRNIMSELMGLIEGVYDAKPSGFVPGGLSIHNTMTAHGPDYESYEKAITQPLHPQFNHVLAFMLETNEYWQVTKQALNHPSLQKKYATCWDGFTASI